MQFQLQLGPHVGWDPTLAVGHADIDAQHQELFRRFAKLVLAMDSGQSVLVADLFAFLAQYAVEHFCAEERLMDETGYPGAGVHKSAHARFVREYKDLAVFYETSGARRAVAVKARTWIEGWLRAHIMGVDLAFARYLQGA